MNMLANDRASTESLENASPTRARRRPARENAFRSATKKLSSGASPRSSPSPEAEHKSAISCQDSNSSMSEFSVLDSTGLSTSSVKKSGDRDVLRVAVRVRPANKRERDSRIVTCEGQNGELMVVNPKKFKASPHLVAATVSAVSRANMETSDWLRPFYFDGVFWSDPSVARAVEEGKTGSGEEGATQQDVYERIGTRIVDDAMNGFNCSCFAYGHTGTGKTYTMFGHGNNTRLSNDPEALAAALDGEEFGLVHRVCYHLLRRLYASRDGLIIHPEAPSPVLAVHFVEIYNDQIRDLLHPMADSSAFRVREHPETGPYVENVVPVEVESWSQLWQLLAIGCSARKEADTPENNKSSRGHAILTLEIKVPGGLTRVQMVDLAGSERDTVSSGNGWGTPQQKGRGSGDPDRRALAQRLRESAQIRKALSNLGVIINGLSRGDTPIGLPFRESTMTWLLKEALSGRAHTTMLATVSPSADDYVETMHTLKYAERLRRAKVHFNAGRPFTGPRVVKPPSDETKKEMRALVKKLGEESVEARRQVLSLTICDPQQRLAKLTAESPRRLRKFDGGAGMGSARYRLSPGSDGNSPSSSPGTPSENLFGRPQRTLSPVHRRRTAEPQSGDLVTWGSPIHAQEERSEDFEDDGISSESKGDEEVGWEGKAHRGGIAPGDDRAERLSFSDEAPEDRGAVGVRGNIDVVPEANGRGASGYADDGRQRRHTFSQQQMDLLNELADDAHGDELYSVCAGEIGRDANTDVGWRGNDDDECNRANSGNGADNVGGAAGRGEKDDYWKQDDHAGTGASRPVDTAASLDAPAGAFASARVDERGRGQRGGRFDSTEQMDGNSATGNTPEGGLCARQRSTPVWGETSSSEENVLSGEARAGPPSDQGREAARSFGINVDEPTPRVTHRQVPVQGDVHVTGSTGPPVTVRYDTHVTVNPGASPTVSVHYDALDPRDPGPIPSVPVRGEGRATGRSSSPNPPASIGSDSHAMDIRSIPLTENSGSVPEASHRAEPRGVDESVGSVRTASPTQRDRRRDSSLMAEEAMVGSGDQHCPVPSAIRRPGASNPLSTRQITWWEGDSDSYDEGSYDGSDDGRHGRHGGNRVREGEDAVMQGSRRDPQVRYHALRGRNSGSSTGRVAARGGRVERDGKGSRRTVTSRRDSFDPEEHSSEDEPYRDVDLTNRRAGVGYDRVAAREKEIEQERRGSRRRVTSRRDNFDGERCSGEDEPYHDDYPPNRKAVVGDDRVATRRAGDEREGRGSRRTVTSRCDNSDPEEHSSEDEPYRDVDLTNRRAGVGYDRAAAREKEVEQERRGSRRRVTSRRDNFDGERRSGEDESYRDGDPINRRTGVGSSAEFGGKIAALSGREVLYSTGGSSKDPGEDEAHEADTISNLRARIAVLEEELQKQTRRADGVDSTAQDTEIWSESARDVERDVDQELDETRQRVRRAELRADEAQERERKARARAEDAINQVEVLRTDLDGVGRELDETRQRVRRAEMRADEAQERERTARARAEGAINQVEVLRTDLGGFGRELDETRQRVRTAEQRADEAQARERQARAHAEDARSQVGPLRTDLDGVGRELDETRQHVMEAEQRADEAQARERQARARAVDALSQVGTSRLALDGVRQELDKTRQHVRETEQRLIEAQAREREAEARAEDTLSQMETLRTDLDDVRLELDETRRRVREANQNVVEAQAREKVAEASAEDALNQVKKMRTDFDGVGQELDDTRQHMTRAEQRADEAQAKEMEAEARAEDAVGEVEALRTVVSSLGRELDETRRRVREAEQLAEGAQTREREARARAEDALRQVGSLRTALDDVGQELDETQRCVREAEQSADEAREREYGAKAHAEDALDELGALRTALDEQRTAAHEAAHRAEQIQAALKSREENEEIALNAARRLAVEEERKRAALAESRAVDAAVSAIKEDAENAVAAARRTGAEQEARRADEAEARADRAVARIEELEAVVDHQENLLNRAKEDLKEKDREIAKEMEETMKHVMERVRTEAKEVRDAMERLEAEKNEAISGIYSANSEVEGLKSRLEAVNKEFADTKKEFEEKMKESSRERAALWLAVNKLDVLEAAKDAAIKELQTDCEEKSNTLETLKSQNSTLARELEQIDVSLLNALEDNGLSIGHVEDLGGTATSERGIHGRQAGDSPIGTQSGPNSPARSDALPSTSTAEDLAANDSRFVHASAAPGRNSGCHGLSQADERKATRSVRGGQRDRGRYRRGMQVSQGGTSTSLAGRARTMFGGSPASIRPDRWDPAMQMNTIEREIDQLSERLNGQLRPTRSSDRLPSESARDSLGSDGVPLGTPRELGTRGASFASGGGVVKRPRVGNSSNL